MKNLLTVIVILLVLLVVGTAVVGIGSYNQLVGLDEAVDGAWAQVENVYQRRADLIPNLVKTVKGAADFEQDTLTQVTEARARVGSITFQQAPTADDLAAFQSAQAGLTSAIARLLVVAERYPELRATDAFRDLQAQLEGAENRITVERMRFNEAARAYNAARRRFPTVLFSGMMGFDAKAYFDAAEGADTPPEVNFGD